MSSMTDTKFTPGPWRYGDWIHKRIGCSGDISSWVDVWVDGGLPIAATKHGNEVANAALIAAAPELYAALADALDSLEYIARNEPRLHGYGVRAERIEAARAALAKARGES